MPFIHATDGNRRLIKVACSDAIVHLVEDRRRYWQTLQYLSGVHEAQLTALHRTDLEELRAQYEQATAARESSLDDIAAAMAELATSSRGSVGLPTGFGGAAAGGAGCRPRPPAALPWPLPPAGSRWPTGRSTWTPPTSPCATTAAPATRSCRSSSRR